MKLTMPDSRSITNKEMLQIASEVSPGMTNVAKDSVRAAIRDAASEQNRYSQEHDSCAIVCNIHKAVRGSHGNVKRTLEALHKMGHRAGDVDGEGDGCGLLTDIPRILWANYLAEAGRPRWLAEDSRFFVGHLLIPMAHKQEEQAVKRRVSRMVQEEGFDLLLARDALTRKVALGASGRMQEPLFWQIAGLVSHSPLDRIDAKLFQLHLRIERETPIHVASFSTHTVVYKVRGDSRTLRNYYPELLMPDYTSKVTIGHTRYSTNTWSVFERVQPFTILGHNGEINTIQRLNEEARMVGAELVPGASDSQDVNRMLETLIHVYGFTLMEAMEILFPPILSNVASLSPDLQALHRYYRYAFGPFAQGPAAIVAHFANEALFSVDALGLRPLWFGETDKEYFFSSERGVVPTENVVRDPKPLAPGEKMAVRMSRDGEIEILDYVTIQQRLLRLAYRRFGSLSPVKRVLETMTYQESAERPADSVAITIPKAPNGAEKVENYLAAFGWRREHRDWVKQLSEHKKEPISSLGADEPLAPLDADPVNLADYIKESVAVVTNPAIDREREAEHFSTQVVVGARPSLAYGTVDLSGCSVVLPMPILIGGYPFPPLLDADSCQQVAGALGTMTVDRLLDFCGASKVHRLDCTFLAEESLPDAIERLKKEAVAAVQSGANLLLLDDASVWSGQRHWIDPHLAIAAVDSVLREEGQGDDNLRRRCGLVLRSGAIRNLHDIVVALGLGANAINPYLLLKTGVDSAQDLSAAEKRIRLTNLIIALNRGIEKVTSTMGIHALRGYGRVFGSIGLSDDLANLLGLHNYCGSKGHGLTWERLEAASRRRAEIAGMARPRLGHTHRLLSRMWKPAGRIARGEPDSSALFRQMEDLEETEPAALRHLVSFATPANVPEISAGEVDAGLTGHDLPFVISSMSFGSQGETAFLAYAEAAYRLNMISLNGEGGEPEDVLGVYPHNRGIQIASARFGITVDVLNSTDLIEIKIGQGAKPGEGGLLPSRKVTAKIAKTRRATQGIDLISPSNNHDIYSIEDLAQFIEELKTVNPKARIAVKLPVVPGVGIIATGVAKAKADVISLSGFEGGTGAARRHAIHYVGMPIEIGVMEAHHALVAAGLRDRVEIWADGGVRTPADVVKLICLGANRVGFGTMSMIAIGCTACRQCQFGTCYKGITTHIESVEEAKEKGVKHFEPLDLDLAVERLVNFFGAMGTEVKRITAGLGFRSVQDLVGRTDLLKQTRALQEVDLSRMLTPATAPELSAVDDWRIGRQVRRPRNHLTNLVSEVIEEAVQAGDTSVVFEDELVGPSDRALGTHLAGLLTRWQHGWDGRPANHAGEGKSYGPKRKEDVLMGTAGQAHYAQSLRALLYFHASSIPGNGLGAFNTDGIEIMVEGGAQDGVAKCACGGSVVVMKGLNYDGKRLDGSVGKYFAYGATRGLFIVQGNADSRACIRLSGADVVLGGRIEEPINDTLGFIGTRANVKGFLCEYMTAGRVVVLGDPGPWICAGMTGGVLYLRLDEKMGLDMEAIHRRLATGAHVELQMVQDEDAANLRYLLGEYVEQLNRTMQYQEAEAVQEYLENWRSVFVKIVPSPRRHAAQAPAKRGTLLAASTLVGTKGVQTGVVSV